METTHDKSNRLRSKNLVICLDGTANNIRVNGNTNVVRALRAFSENRDEEHDPGCTGQTQAGGADCCQGYRPRQLLYYDPGVGTFSSSKVWTPIGRLMSRLSGLAFGTGLKTNLAEAYTFLMNNWNPGDRIYIFGFSRGAFTARALAGLLHKIGIPRRSSENLVEYAIREYARRKKVWDDADTEEARSFRVTVCRLADPKNDTVVGAGEAGALTGDQIDEMFSVPVAFIGLWDTVSAPGIFGRSMLFDDSDDLPNVEQGRHAIAIDEWRRPYKEQPVGKKSSVEELWFAGVHSDVGGSSSKGSGLGNITLMWVLRGAIQAGIVLRKNSIAGGLPEVMNEMAGEDCNKNSWVWRLLIPVRRTPAEGTGRLHCSVSARIALRPKDRAARRLEHLPVVADDGWFEVPVEKRDSAYA